MKKAFLYLCLYVLPCALSAQTDCPFYKTYIEKGEAELKKGDKADFKKAIEAFSNAMVHCPAKADEARNKILNAFNAIDALKKQAVRNAEMAKKAQDATKIALLIADSSRQKAEDAQNATKAALQKAEAVLDKIYFYKDKFGLAYDRNEGKYGFIDKDLNTKIAFQYDEALPFDYTGLAKVKKGNIYYLIDTKGKDYRLATDINQLNTDVTALDLRSKNLSEIPPSVFRQTQLEVLLLKENKIKQIPKSMKALVNLLYLDLSDNQISKIEGLDNLTALQQLDIWSNQISKIEGLDNLTALQQFYISDNQISKIEGLDNLTALQQLDISENQISKIEGLEKLTTLQQLNIGHNQISKIEGLEKLAALQQLDILDNQISKIEGLEKLAALQHLDISFNQIGEIEDLEQLTTLQQLDIWSNKISKIEGLEKLAALKQLNIGHNQISKLEGLEKLTALQQLTISYNQISKLEGLEKLGALQQLDISSNQINKIGSLDKQAKNIKTIDLSGNPLSLETLNQGLLTLPNLEDLYLRRLNLTHLPEAVLALKQLKVLDFKSYEREAINNFSEAEQEKIKKLLPNCIIEF